MASEEANDQRVSWIAACRKGSGGNGNGRSRVEDAAIIKTALAAPAAPMSAAMAGTDPDCGEEARDRRDHGARTWDALVEACQRLQDAEVLPESHGTKPRLTLTLDYDALKTGVGTGSPQQPSAGSRVTRT